MKTTRDILESTNIPELLQHCKDGVIENNHINGGSFSDWDDGRHIADTYLDFGDQQHPFLEDYDSYQEIVSHLNDWLSTSIEERVNERVERACPQNINTD